MTNLEELREWIERIARNVSESSSDNHSLEDVKVSVGGLPERIVATWMDEEFIIYLAPDKTKKEATRT